MMERLPPVPKTNYLEVQDDWQLATKERCFARAERALQCAEGNLDQLSKDNSGKLTVEQVVVMVEARSNVALGWSRLGAEIALAGTTWFDDATP